MAPTLSHSVVALSAFLVFISWSDYDDGSGNGCNYNGAMDEESWYMGLAPCYRANAAYSLYGVLKGDKHAVKGCRPKNFINSFFTTRGVETFTAYMGYAGASFTSASNDDDTYAGGVSSYCQAAENDDDGANDNGDDGYSHGDKLGSGYSSYGVGCSATGGQYEEKTFQGQYCTESPKTKVTDTLTTFNSDMDQISCTQIYSSSGQDNDGGSPLELLVYSRACSVLEYPGVCPDPHGKLLSYERRLEDSTGFVHNQRKERVRKNMAWILMVVGLVLIIVALISYRQTRAKNNLRIVKIAQQKNKKPSLWQRFLNIFRRRQNRKTSPQS